MFDAGARVGLSSWLFFLDLDPLDGAALTGLNDRRMGDGSREGLVELAAEEETDRSDADGGVVQARFTGGTDGGKKCCE
jgi:hypothetical protein